MKLIKPPFTEEQSILEEYVDFLLLDHSNVHPFPGDKNAEKKNTPKLKKSKSAKVIIERPVVVKSDLIVNEQAKATEVIVEKEKCVVSGEAAKQLLAEQRTNSSIKKPFEIDEESEQVQMERWNRLISDEQKNSVSVIKVEDDNPHQTNDNFVKSNSADEALEYHSIAAEKKIDSNEQLINEYLIEEKDDRLRGVEQLLARISLATMPAPIIKSDEDLIVPVSKVTSKQQEADIAEAEQATFVIRKTQKAKEILPSVFQTLIFKVAQLPLAVPLIKLGGIVKFSQEDVTRLVGTPDWFLGLVPNDRGSLMVIDTQKYLMPERAQIHRDSSYQYLILLDDSNWALACHSVGDAKNLTHDDIRWSEKSSRRPWFAGMVVDYMSALIEVDELINMLASNIVE